MREYEIIAYPQHAEDGTVYWTAVCPAFAGVVGGGDTAADAFADFEENLRIYLDYLQAR